MLAGKIRFYIQWRAGDITNLFQKQFKGLHSYFGTMTASKPVRLRLSGHATLRMTTKKFISNSAKISRKSDTWQTQEMYFG
jgi:hypothetical protein